MAENIVLLDSFIPHLVYCDFIQTYTHTHIVHCVYGAHICGFAPKTVSDSFKTNVF